MLQLGILVASGSPAVCLEWSIARALAAGATEDEIADVLLAIAPVTGLGRVVCAAPDAGQVGNMQGKCIARETLTIMTRMTSPGVFRQIAWENGSKLLGLRA